MDTKLRNMTSIYLVNDTGILCLYRIGSRVADKMYIGSAGVHFEKDELNDPKKCVLRGNGGRAGTSRDRCGRSDPSLCYLPSEK